MLTKIATTLLTGVLATTALTGTAAAHEGRVVVRTAPAAVVVTRPVVFRGPGSWRERERLARLEREREARLEQERMARIAREQRERERRERREWVRRHHRYTQGRGYYR